MGSLKKYFFGRNKSLNKGLVAYYKFDSNANDSVGGVNGVLTNSPTFTAGKVANGINFLNDTTLRYCQLPDNDNFSFTYGGGVDMPFSMSFWIYIHAFSTQFNTIMVKRANDSLNEEYFIALLPTSITLTKYTNNFASKSLNNSYTFSINTWYHIVITDDGTKTGTTATPCFIDGVSIVPVVSYSGTYGGMPNGTAPVRIGSTSVNPNEQRKHKGMMDELGIWKGRILNQTDVNLLYNSGSGRTYPF